MGAQGTALLDFGAFPGKSDASVAVTGQAGILAGSLVEAWLFPADTADHKADEHMVEPIRVTAGSIIAGTGFTIYGVNVNPLVEHELFQPWPQYPLKTVLVETGRGTRIWGRWTVGWVWN